MSSSPSTSTSVIVTATGVLVDPSLSCALELHQQLTTKYNELIKPFSSNKLALPDLLIAVDGDMDRQKPVSTLLIPQSGKPLTMHFSIPQGHTFRVVLNKNKENLAQTLSKSSRRKQKKVASGSEVDNNASSLKEMMDRINDLTDQLNTSNIEQAKHNNEQSKRIKDLEAANAELSAANAELSAANAELSASVQKMNATLQHHSTMLHALHRRVLLDDARTLIANRYGFPISELRSGGQVVAGSAHTLEQLVLDVRSKLTKEDARWLHPNELRMIFDAKLGTLRSGGNAVAHCASEEDLGLAIKDPSLHPLQIASSQDIYRFTHNGILDI
ncbi:hypothetical protein F4604DRAFT_1794158 [Suillus subluteus]|nr:hypothetical protein F4604DRAFT_1794158 [Suillus subluteus]